MVNSKQSIEHQYQKKTQIEHILLRPDTYIGSIESTNDKLWVMADNDEKFEHRSIELVPGLYKIFDEILVNAADNYQKDKSMNTIKISIDQKSIEVWNNGKGIPVVIHKEQNLYVPEMVFGHLLTSSNYDDLEKKVTGGRNGYGAKLTNIYSKKFIVETADSEKLKKFQMIWENNMSKCSEPKIEVFNGSSDYTSVKFYPDFERFGIKELSKDMMDLMKKRVYDLSGVISSNVKVFLNNKRLQVKGFQDYVNMYLPKDQLQIVEKQKNDRWEVVVSLADGQFQQVSFVNSICTSRGGTHVNYITDQIVDKLQEQIKKKHKSLQIKPFQIKQHLWIFVNSLIENPAFDSQTKETLTTKANKFGSKCELSEKFIKDVLKSGILDQIVNQAQLKEQSKMAKTLTGQKKSKLLGIPKLEDANEAGSRNADRCTLILTEGDSAKNVAMSGLEILGRDYYGVFPLKGKLLNVRDSSATQITQNAEIQNLIKIIGLQVGKTYENTKNLRYGQVMIMADQDSDGSHIKGLVLNFFHHFWPSLVKLNSFVSEFVTPLIKATKGQQVRPFFTIQDFEKFAEETPDIKNWKIKYYKGLGTSTDKEAQDYFQALIRHQIRFEYVNELDDQAIYLAFQKNMADNRKDWLSKYDPKIYVDHTKNRLRINDFVHKELIQFSMADNIRSIPSLCDGLKPGQRKILYSCFKRKLTGEVKVAQLSGYVAEHSAYHHGEASLAQTIVGMAQDFVGSNNINLLLPIGQFGSRNMGGKEAASARYIYTSLSKITRLIFPEDDDNLLEYLEDDGQQVEPVFYAPIIPLSLINGSEGIGTGWSTFVPQYNPLTISQMIKDKLQMDKEFEELTPFYRGYKGDISVNPKGGYIICGDYTVLDDVTLEINELSIRKWTRDYKNFLESMMEGQSPDIDEVKEYHTGNDVRFIVKMNSEKNINLDNRDTVLNTFKLQGQVNTSNMVMFDQNLQLKKYQSTTQIMNEFFEMRKKFYEKRKIFLRSKIQRELEILENKVNFIESFLNDSINIRNKKKTVLIAELVQKGFKQMKDICKIQTNLLQVDQLQQPQEDDDNDVVAKEYNYLLNLPIYSLTYERVQKLRTEHQDKVSQLKILEATTISEMWIRDLEKFEECYEQLNSESIQQQKCLKANSRQPGMKQKQINKPKKIKKIKNSDEESSVSDDGSDFDIKPQKKETKTTTVEQTSNKNLATQNGKQQQKSIKTKGKPESKKQIKQSDDVQESKQNNADSSKKKKLQSDDDDFDLNTKKPNSTLTKRKKIQNDDDEDFNEETDSVENKVSSRPKRTNKQQKISMIESDDDGTEKCESDYQSDNQHIDDQIIDTKSVKQNDLKSDSKIHTNVDTKVDTKIDQNSTIQNSKKTQEESKPNQKKKPMSVISDTQKDKKTQKVQEKKQKQEKTLQKQEIKPEVSQQSLEQNQETLQQGNDNVKQDKNKIEPFQSSILKYLTPSSQVNTHQLSLLERIKLREQQGQFSQGNFEQVKENEIIQKKVKIAPPQWLDE